MLTSSERKKGVWMNVKLDEIGPWSEVKLDIVRKYASAYTTVMKSFPSIRRYIYIDAFAGAGTHIRKQTGEMVKGSPLNALLVQPPFHEFHFIDLDGGKAQRLKKLSGDRNDVFVYEGDCNAVLLDKVFPLARYADYRRALCLLDPYALNLRWEVIKAAGESKSVEIFLNFMIMDVNMNVLKHDRSKVEPAQEARLTGLWGDEGWRPIAYPKQDGLFGSYEEKSTNAALAAGFRQRLTEAGFAYVPEPLPMKNSTGAVVYYLYFASPNKTGGKIVKDIFAKYR
jgi:three-Cys-motif partner protein